MRYNKSPTTLIRQKSNSRGKKVRRREKWGPSNMGPTKVGPAHRPRFYHWEGKFDKRAGEGDRSNLSGGPHRSPFGVRLT